jgi:hypothetical protein
MILVEWIAPGIHELDHLLDREPVREHHRLGAAIAAGGEQLEGAAATDILVRTLMSRL